MKDPVNSNDFELRAVEKMRTLGHRMTMPRLQVIRVLANSTVALTAQQIHAKVLGFGGRMDVVSVYRTLATLTEAHLVHHIGVVDGYMACHQEEHSDGLIAHAICQRCGRIQELEPATLALQQSINKEVGAVFNALEIRLEALGLCFTCKPPQGVRP